MEVFSIHKVDTIAIAHSYFVILRPRRLTTVPERAKSLNAEIKIHVQ